MLAIIFKVLLVIIFILILISLSSGMFFLIKDAGSTSRVLTSLKFRIGLSVTLFLLLFVGKYFGFLEPHGIIPPEKQKAPPSQVAP